MNKIKLSFLSAAICFSLSSTAGAEDLLTIYNLAAQHDPDIRAAYADRNATRELKPQATSVLVPQISGQVNVTATDESVKTNLSDRDNSEDFENFGYRLDLTQAVYHHDQWVGLKIADAQIGEAEAKYASAEQNLAFRVTDRYFNVLKAWENLKFTRVEKEATGSQLDQTKKRFEVGLISITDVNEAQARYDLAVAQEIQAQNDISNTQEQLRELTDKYHVTLNSVGDAFTLISPLPANIDEWTDFAIKKNPDLKAVEYVMEAALENVNLQRAGHYPTVDIVGNLTYDNSNKEGAFEPETEVNSISLQVSVPIFQGGIVSSKTREAAHQHESAKEQLSRQRRLTVSQTRQAFLSVLASISRTRALEQAVKSNKSALDATKAGFDVGTRTIEDVLNAQQEYHRAIRDAAQERYTYIVNTIQLKQASGMLVKADLQQINAWLSNRVLLTN